MSGFWQWFFAIIGLVAFIMATPSILQLIFGQPRIGYSFTEDDSGQGRLIKICLTNPPINNNLLQFFRVSKMSAQDVFLGVTVKNAKTKEPIGDQFIPEIVLSNSQISTRVALPPSILMACSILVKWQRETNSAILLYGTNQKTLSNGKYLFYFQLGLDGRIKHLKQIGLLNVGNTEHELMWDENIKEKFFM